MSDTVTVHRPATVTTPTPQTIKIQREFDAPRERVWQAFTERDLVKRWWGRGNDLDVKVFEVERGGHWRFEEHAGGETHGFEGRFREVSPIDRLSYTFEWDGMPGHTIVETVEFFDLGDGRTRIENTSMFFTQADRDGMIQSGMESGLNESYAALDRLLAESR